MSGYDVLSLAWDGTVSLRGILRPRSVWRYDPVAEAWTDTGGGREQLRLSYSLAWDGSSLYAGTYNQWRVALR